MSSSAYASWLLPLTRFWDRLIEPSTLIQDSSERLRVRFLAATYLLSTIFMLVLVPVRYLIDPEVEHPIRQTAVSVTMGMILFACYFLTRRGYSRFASAMMVIVLSVLIFVLLSLADLSLATRNLNYLILLVLFASHSISLRFTIILSALHILMMLSFFLPRMPLDQLIKGSLTFQLFATLIIVIFTDYRRRIEHERQARLAESEIRYREVSGLTPNYSYSFRSDGNGKLVKEWVTDSFQDITGYTWEELDKSGVLSLYHPDDVERQAADLQQVYAGKPITGIYRIVTKSGQVRWLQVSRNPIVDGETGRLTRYYGIAQDITDRKRVEEQQLQMALQHERSSLVNNFVSAFSHDFRTSLSIIETSRYLIQRLLAEPDRDKVQPRLDMIQKYVSHMEEQLENLRSVSALADLQRTACNLNEVMQQVMAEQGSFAQQRHQTLSFSPCTTAPIIQADTRELGHAITHLVRNAVNYTQEGGTIQCATTHSGTTVSVEIRDNGAGIAPEHIPHVFELFYRADPSRKVDLGGVGLGLSIVKMVVEAHGGTVKLESEPGKGTAFLIILPIDPTPVLEPQP